MVAVIHSGKSLVNPLNYNEQKVKQGKAKCLAAVNYPKDIQNLNFYQKRNRLTNQASLNQRTKENSVHISLNFDPREILSETTLKEIAVYYMKKIGFGGQPFLVYQHHDAGHPHLHIVTTNIKADGKRIALHNIGRNQSEKARKELEIAFKLVKASDKQSAQGEDIKRVNAHKIQYGKSETKRAISNVLNAVLNSYKYTSLPELNAVLRLYNVEADRGSEGSRIWQHNGLVYRVLDENGQKLGVPIKASLIYNKPTMKFLEEKFRQNEILRQPFKKGLRNRIDWALLKMKHPSLTGLIQALEKEGMQTILRKNKEGLIYGITWVDHNSKSVFNGSDLGREYSAKGILERIGEGTSLQGRQKPDIDPIPISHEHLSSSESNASVPLKSVIDQLLTPMETNTYLPWQLKKSRRKRKKTLGNL